jgi:ornithine carbamoyltransferase
MAAMHHPLHHRRVWTLDELTREDVLALLRLLGQLKAAAAQGDGRQPLRGRKLALLGNGRGDGQAGVPDPLQQAALALGAQVSRVRSQGLPATLGDTARLLGRLYDAVDCPGLGGEALQRLDREAGIPVFNGLADGDHPLGALAELATLQQLAGRRPLSSLRLCYVGDGLSAAGDALLHAAALAGAHLTLVADPHDEPPATRWTRLCTLAKAHGGTLTAVTGLDRLAAPPDLTFGNGPEGAWRRRQHQVFLLQAVLVSTLA